MIGIRNRKNTYNLYDNKMKFDEKCIYFIKLLIYYYNKYVQIGSEKNEYGTGE